MRAHTYENTRACTLSLYRTQPSANVNIFCLFAEVSGTLLTCRQNTFSLPRRGWTQALEENLGEEKMGAI